MIIKDKMKVTISTMFSKKKTKMDTTVGLFGFKDVILRNDDNKEVLEPLMLPTNSGRQASHNVTVIVSCNKTDYKKVRNEDKIIIFPAETNLESVKVFFILIEVIHGSPRQNVIQTLRSLEVTKRL